MHEPMMATILHTQIITVLDILITLLALPAGDAYSFACTNKCRYNTTIPGDLAASSLRMALAADCNRSHHQHTAYESLEYSDCMLYIRQLHRPESDHKAG